MVSITRLDVASLDDATRRAWLPFTQPEFASCLSGRHPENVEDAEIIAIVATLNNRPVGLLLASFFPLLKLADLHSLQVNEDQTLQEKLMQEFEKQLIHRQALVATCTYPANLPTSAQFESFLASQHWAQGKPFGIKVYFDKNFKAPWLNQDYYMPEGMKICLWNEVTPEEKEYLRYQKDQGQFPIEISPFRCEELIEPSTSLALRYKGKIVGWLITHRISEDTIRYDAFYIQKEFQHQGPSVRLLAEAIKLNIASLFLYNAVLMLNLSQTDQSWHRFIQKRLIPYARQVVRLSQSWKKIPQNLESVG